MYTDRMIMGCGMLRVVSIEFLWLAVVTAVLATVGAMMVSERIADGTARAD
jgi:hypothetical protein